MCFNILSLIDYKKDLMTTIESAIDSAYQAQIKNLYNALSQAVLAANDDSDAISAAETSFKKRPSLCY